MKKKTKKALLGDDLKPKPLSSSLQNSSRLTQDPITNAFNTISQGQVNKAIGDQYASLVPGERQPGFDWASVIPVAAAQINSLIPGDRPDRWKTVQPLEIYNPFPNGTGSQAIYEDGGNVKAYNPKLASTDKLFQKWYNTNTLEGKRGVPFSDQLDYDYYSFFRNSGKGNIQDHFPDTFKRPIHETFSNESIYSTPENPGGSWNGDTYIPMKGKKKAANGMGIDPLKPVNSNYKFKLTSNADTDLNLLTDGLGYSLANGVNPLKDKTGMMMMDSKNPLKQKLITSVIAHNAANPKYGENSISDFYNSPSQDPEVQEFKRMMMGRTSNDPLSAYKKSPLLAGTASSRDLLTKMPDGGKVDPILGPINYANSYRNSAEWLKRKSGNNPGVDNKIYRKAGDIWAGMYDPKVINNGEGSSTKRDTRPNVILNTGQAKLEKMDLLNDVLPHEYSHLTTTATPNDLRAYAKANKNSAALPLYNSFADPNGKLDKKYNNMDVETFHDITPEENHADMDSLRYLMYKEGIYDTRQGPMTKEHLQKAMKNPKVNSQFTFKRMLKYYKPQDIIRLNNTIAQNDNDGQPMAKNGFNMQGQLAIESHSPISEDTTMIEGNSHADGGTMVQYGGNVIEAEKGEPISINQDGSATIWGNLKVPGTKEKFKSVVKKIGQKEAKYDKLQVKATDIISGANPNSKFGKLAFNSAKVMHEGAEMAKEDLSEKKHALAMIQSALLAEKPKKAKNGITIAAKGAKVDPKPLYAKMEELARAKLQALYPGKNVRITGTGESRPIEEQRGLKAKGFSKTSVSLHNVGGARDYLMYVDGKQVTDTGVYNQVLQSSAKEVGLFGVGDWDPGHVGAVEEGKGNAFSTLIAKHPDLMGGDNYKKTTAYIKKLIDSGKADKQEIQAYNQLTGSNIPLSKGLKKTDANESLARLPKNVNWFGETPIPQAAPPTKLKLPDIPLNYTPPTTPTVGNPSPPPLGEIKRPVDRNIPSNAEELSPLQYLPELYTYGKNQVDPVPLQQVNPDLFSPYQVSFQDRINDNASTFTALTRQVSGNPAILQGLAANKYAADSQVGAEEFRTNQSIYNDIINRNNALLNDSQMKNLALADQQYVRQQASRDNTDSQNELILNSLSSKELQNNYENKRLGAYENLYNFRMTDSNNDGTPDKAKYFGPDALFGATPSTGDPAARTATTYDGSGNVKATTVSTPSAAQIEEQRLKIQKLKSQTPAFSWRKFFP